MSTAELQSWKDSSEWKMAKPAIKTVVSKELNARAGKYKVSPAQNRARLLGQLKFFGTSSTAMLEQCQRRIDEARGYTDLTESEVRVLSSMVIMAQDKVRSLLLQVEYITTCKQKHRDQTL